LPTESEDPNDLVTAQQRDIEDCMDVAEANCFLKNVIRINGNIRDVSHPAFEQHAPNPRASAGRKSHAS
jgi:hypothetical protein